MPKEGLNSVTSVPAFSRGPSAPKSRPMTFPKVSPTSPLYELYLWWSDSFLMPQRSPISPIILSTVLSAMRSASTARSSMAIWRRPTPSGGRPKIPATLPRSSGLVGLLGCASA